MKSTVGFTRISILTFVCMFSLGISGDTFANDSDDLKEQNLLNLLFNSKSYFCPPYPYCDITHNNIQESQNTSKQDKSAVQLRSNSETSLESTKKE